jgi:RecB family endonuclease NucS
MTILVARCEIAYHGRATTRLGAGDRVTLFKDDGSLCVHAEKGYKPLKSRRGKPLMLGKGRRERRMDLTRETPSTPLSRQVCARRRPR